MYRLPSRRIWSGLAGALLAVGTLVVLAWSPNSASASSYNNYNYSFRGCEWTFQMESLGPIITGARARTFDRNGGCRMLDADVKYVVNGTSEVRTKYCFAEITDEKVCEIHEFNRAQVHLHSARGRAQDAESGYYWQSSGWKKW